MKIWIDIITPKDLTFFKPMAEKLSKKHTVLCTSRNFNEINVLAKLHKFKVVTIGHYGGKTKEGKLFAAVERMSLLTKKIKTFSPDLLISFCSPDACRVAYGFGIKQIGFIDGVHGVIPMRLTIPLLDKLLTPDIFSKKSFTTYGITSKNIIQYNAFDGAYTIKHKTSKTKLPYSTYKKNILIRMPEDNATYMPQYNYLDIIKAIIEKFHSENIVILVRYKEQITKLSTLKTKSFKITDMKHDGRSLLEKCDIFVGSGGTMTTEACMMGIRCAVMSIFPNPIFDFLLKHKFLTVANTPHKMVSVIEQLLKTPKSHNKKRAKMLVDSMEDPYDVLVETIQKLF